MGFTLAKSATSLDEIRNKVKEIADKMHGDPDCGGEDAPNTFLQHYNRNVYVSCSALEEGWDDDLEELKKIPGIGEVEIACGGWPPGFELEDYDLEECVDGYGEDYNAENGGWEHLSHGEFEQWPLDPNPAVKRL